MEDSDKEAAFYDWLKICINPENNPNYDFYFEMHKKLDKEKEVKGILFDEKGALRGTFTEPAWRIRLRKIKIWFQKRYDLITAWKIEINLIGKKMLPLYLISLLLSLKIFFPIRLSCAISIGFIPLLVESGVWEVALRLSWADIGPISGLALLIIFLYFLYECSKVTGGGKSVKSLLRTGGIVLCGVLVSVGLSTILCGMFSHHFIDFTNALADWSWYVLYVNLGPYFLAFHGRIIIFFATAAFLIGTFIQVIWEEKTITEPL